MVNRKKYIIANRSGWKIRTDILAKAEKKFNELQAANDPYILFYKAPEGIMETWTKDPDQKNYRMRSSKIDAGTKN